MSGRTSLTDPYTVRELLAERGSVTLDFERVLKTAELLEGDDVAPKVAKKNAKPGELEALVEEMGGVADELWSLENDASNAQYRLKEVIKKLEAFLPEES